MALKVNTVYTGLQIKITETGELDRATGIALSLGYTLGDGMLDRATGIALSLGYTVIDGALNCSKDFIDNQGEYQGYYDPNAGIGAIWIDDNSEAYVRFNSLGGESWISNI